MQTSSIEALNGQSSIYTQTASDTPSDEITYDDFMNLLVTQMRYQDPLDPMDNNQFIEQTTNLTQLEELTKISTSIESLTASLQSDAAGGDQLLSASSFLGKEVTYSSSNIEVAEGQTEFMFNLPTSAAGATINIFDSMGVQVASYTPSQIENGENKISWNGVDDSGKQLTDGVYSYKVDAVDANGEGLDSWTYAKGVVDSVTSANGSLLFTVGNQKVDYNLIYSVSENTGS